MTHARPAVYLITGIPAAGKSTVAQLLAERLDRSVHVRGDAFRRMVVSGRADMTPPPSAEAVRQLELRHQLTASVSDQYAAAGFTVVAQDVILGHQLTAMIGMIRTRPLLVVVLAPDPAVVARRRGRPRARTPTAPGRSTSSTRACGQRPRAPASGSTPRPRPQRRRWRRSWPARRARPALTAGPAGGGAPAGR